MKKYGLIVVFFVIAIVLVYFFGNNHDYIKIGNLYISEILASNSYTLKDSDGEYSDYIEIYNGYNYKINLEGFRLTDNLVNIKKWTFPDITINEGEYLIIYASGKDVCLDKNNCHTNFKLNNEGETISLIDNTGNIISRVTYNELSMNTSYSFVKNKYLVTAPSPGIENNKDEIKKIDVSKYKIKINEYLSHNKGSNYTSDGAYYDWVELYNEGNNDLNLLGISLSDDPDDLDKFILPDITLKAHEYLVIYLTGGVMVENEVCANFKLSDNDSKIILSGNSKVIDEVEVVKLDKNMSYGRRDDKWLYFLAPTPGSENNTYGVERWDE